MAMAIYWRYVDVERASESDESTTGSLMQKRTIHGTPCKELKQKSWRQQEAAAAPSSVKRGGNSHGSQDRLFQTGRD